ncbi:MAG TPA: phage minor head protein [Patescibacteria group bacterium]|jgi:SPP1 gp7 family putative phage head morphogenesis protein|nr:phage minor head protein [Patescibacteria group bacterium]
MSLDYKIRQINAAVGRYLNKVNRRNQPLDYWKTEKQFQQFTNLLKDGLSDQMSDIADNFAHVKDSRLKPTNPDFKTYLGSWMHKNFRGLGTRVPKADVESYLTNVFEYSAKTSYLQQGILVKSQVKFNLTNDFYLQEIADQAGYLLNKSSIDSTTFDALFEIIYEGLTDGLTPYEVSVTITENIDMISGSRALLIANTETANAMGKAQQAWMKENGIHEKEWVTAGKNICPICRDNAAQGPIPVNQEFQSGHIAVPAHPNCECYVNSVKTNLSDIPIGDLWDGN